MKNHYAQRLTDEFLASCNTKTGQRDPAPGLSPALVRGVSIALGLVLLGVLVAFVR